MGQDGAGATLAYQGAAARRSFVSDPKSRLGPRSDTQRTAVQSDRGVDEFSAINNAERGTWRTLFAARFPLPGSRRLALRLAMAVSSNPARSFHTAPTHSGPSNSPRITSILVSALHDPI